MRAIIHEGVAVDIATIPNCLRISTYRISVRFLMALVQWCSVYVSFLKHAGASRMQLSASMPSGSKDRSYMRIVSQ